MSKMCHSACIVSIIYWLQDASFIRLNGRCRCQKQVSSVSEQQVKHAARLHVGEGRISVGRRESEDVQARPQKVDSGPPRDLGCGVRTRLPATLNVA